MIRTVPLRVRQALVQFQHTFLSCGLASSSLRGSYFTPGTLKAALVALVKPVAYLRYLVNKLVRSDRGLQTAFGRSRCAEQSVIQETLDASTAENVSELHQAMDAIYQHHSQGYRHDYQQGLQILDVDMSGHPCGPKAMFATKGYFTGKRNRQGRQLGRVLATRYDEIVCDRTFEGTVQLTKALQPLLQASEETLGIAQSARTLVRIDSGGGCLKDINWMLSRNYRVLTKDSSSQRAKKLAASVTEWFDDPAQPGRQVGFVTTASADDYCRPVIRIAVRCRKNNGHWAIGVLVTNLPPDDVATLMNTDFDFADNLCDLWLAYVRCYDQRGGGVETSFKQDNQALGIKKRNKKRFHAQQMLTQLNALAHNVLVWARRWLTADTPALKPIGFVRLIRDVLTTTGQLFFNSHGQLIEIRLNAADTLVRPWVQQLSLLLKSLHVARWLGNLPSHRATPGRPNTKKLRICFEDSVSLSPGFTRWLRNITEPALEERFTSAKAALRALDQSHLTAPLTKPPSPAALPAVQKPAGSKVSLTQQFDQLDIVIPPKGFTPALIPTIGFAIVWNAFMLNWYAMAFRMGVFGLFPGLFGILHLGAGLWMIYTVLFALFGTVFLHIDDNTISLKYGLLGFFFQRPKPAPREHIMRLEKTQATYRRSHRGRGNYSKPQLNIWVPAQIFSMGESLTDVERTWLASELSKWLDLPVKN